METTSEQLRATREVVRGVEKAGQALRVHGNGFLQLDLGQDRRLHIWGHPGLPRQRVETPIHDHRFGFTSRVLVGRLVNVRYETRAIRAVPRHDDLYQAYTPVPREGEDTRLEATEGEPPCRLLLASAELIPTGESYTMMAGDLHETMTDRPSATLMYKGTSRVMVPRVMVPMGHLPDNDFNRNIALTTQEAYRILWEVLGR